MRKFTPLLLVILLLISGCVQQKPEDIETTTTVIPTTTVKIPILTTTTTVQPIIEHDCDKTRFRVKYFKHEGESLVFYLENIGSVHIYNFVARLKYPDKKIEKNYDGVYLEVKEMEKYTIKDLEAGLQSVTISVPGCVFEYFFDV